MILYYHEGKNSPEKCCSLMTKFNYEQPLNFQIGLSKIYFQVFGFYLLIFKILFIILYLFKIGVLEELEDKRKKYLEATAIFLQRIMRGNFN